MTTFHRRIVLAALAAAWAAARAQSYPNRPITLIVPLAAGSTADVLARALQPELSRRLGQPMVIDNRVGAGGGLGMAALAQAAPDGYTLGIASNGTWAINVGLYPKLAYDPLRDLAPIAFLASGANVLVVHPDSPYRSVRELIAAMRKAPGRLAFSSGGNGTTHHLSGELLKARTDTFALHIPYRGAPQGVQAVAAHEVDFGFFNTPSVLGLIKAGRLRGLAVTSLQRSPLVPELPTMIEAGVADFEVGVAFGLVAPAGLPPALVERWNAEIGRVLADPALRRTLQAQGFDLHAHASPAQFAALQRADQARWVPLVKRSGATVD